MQLTTTTAIHYHVASRQQQQQIKQKRSERFRLWREFRESYCDMFTRDDFEYYADEIGVKLSTIYRFARFHDESQRFYAGMYFSL